MSWHVTVSGPKSSIAQARTALAQFELLGDDDRGLAELPSKGKARPQPQAFLTVRAEDVDQVVAKVAGLGWVLRAHHPEPLPLPKAREDTLAATLLEMQREIALLKAKVN